MSVPTSSWSIVSLGSVLKVKNGRSQKDIEAPSGRYPILATGGEIGRTDTPLYSKPSVLIGRKGTINRPQFQESPFWTVDTLFYTEVSARADARYLYYLCTTIDWMSLNEATGVPSLTGRRIESVEVLLPSLDEQQHISAVLKDADELIASLERLIAKKRSIKQGLMQELLTGRTRVTDSDGIWRTCSISKLATIVKGQQLGRAEMSVHGDVEVWNGGVEPSGFTVAPNIFHTVVTVSEGGNSCGWVGKPQSGFWLGGHCYALTPSSSGLPIEFLYQLLKFREIDLMALRVGSGLPNIQKRALLDFSVRVPVDVGEASRIAEILKDADAEIAALERRLVSARFIKQGMMQELLTGRTRLPAEVAA